MVATATRGRRHLLEPDEQLADPYDALRRAQHGLPPRQWCRRCGLPGAPGDERHYPTALIRQWRERDAAVVGERLDG